MSRLCIFANIFVATFFAMHTVAFEKNLDTYLADRQKLIAEENGNFLGTVWNFCHQFMIYV